MRSQVIYITQLAYMQKWTRLCLFVLVGFALSACGGSGDFKSPEPFVDTEPPSVISFFPDDDTSEQFEVDSHLELTFSELMSIESLMPSEGGIKLFSGSLESASSSDEIPEERDVSLEFDVTPVYVEDPITGKDKLIPSTEAYIKHSSGRFALNTEYSIEVNSPARDLIEDDLTTAEDERNFMTKSFILEFTTEQGQWKESKSIPNLITIDKGTPNQFIKDQNSNQFSPRLISNASGETFLIWRQELYPGINQLWASRYRPNERNLNKWSLINPSDNFCNLERCENAELLSEITTTTVIDFDVDVNEQGHFAVAWSQAPQVNEYVSIWAKIFNGTNWSSIEKISNTGITDRGNAESPSIGLDREGNAISIWREHNGQYSRIKANFFKLGDDSSIANGQWVEAPIYLDSGSDIISRNPKLAINGSGLAIAVWEQKNTDSFQIFSNHIRLSQGDNWIGSKRIDLISLDNPEFAIGGSSSPSIGIDENGDAIAVWLKHDGQRNNVWFNHFTGDWLGLSSAIEESRVGDASSPSITMKNNKALAYWVQENRSSNILSLHTSFFTPFTGWQTEEVLATNNGIAEPNAKFDREGNAMILWQTGPEFGTINARYFSTLTNEWETQEPLKFGGAPSLTTLFEDGRFLVAWYNESNSQYRLESALFSN